MKGQKRKPRPFRNMVHNGRGGWLHSELGLHLETKANWYREKNNDIRKNINRKV